MEPLRNSSSSQSLRVALLAATSEEMNLLAEEASAAVRRQVQQITAAKREAEDLKTIARRVEDLMSVELLYGGPMFPRLRRAFKNLESKGPGFVKAYRRFVADSSALLPSEVQATLEKFIAWLPEEAEALDRRWEQYKAELVNDALDVTDDDKQTAADWAVTTGDGLSD